MPIQPQSNPTIPYLRRFIPYQLSPSIIACDLIEDMVSYSLISDQVNTINYYVGSADVENFILDVKNLTEQAVLEIMITFDNNIFLAGIMNNTLTRNPVEFSLNAKSQKSVMLNVNKENLNSKSDYERLNSTILLTVQNIPNGRLVTKNISTPMLQQQRLPIITMS